jgi:Fic family protein
MDIKEFKAGTMKKGYEYMYFMPENINHGYFWTDDIINELLERASIIVGELNAFSRFVPDTNMFIMMHTFKEAVVSSRIEGTRTNVEEALFEESEISPEKRDDWNEVNNYVRALNSAIADLKNLPLSNRMIKNAHKILLSSVRGEHKSPGEFRSSQNWIGGATLADAVFIPPPHNELPGLLSDFEKFLHNTEIHIPHLVRIAIAHYQFETIHPFLDGNGRVGRLVITLYLVSSGLLEKPLLYLSDFFEKNKGLYYDNLTFVRTNNNLAQWLKFFLTGVIQTGENALFTLKTIIELKTNLEKNIIITMGKRTEQGYKLLDGLFTKPVVSVRDVERITGLSAKSANDLVDVFVEKNILRETSGQRRNRIFVFSEYIKLF